MLATAAAAGNTAAWVLVGVTAVLAVTTGIYAIFTKMQVHESYESRKLATNPNVIAYLDVDHRYLAYFVLKNIGHGPAHSVQIVINPPMKSSKWDPMEMSILKDGVAYLPPGQELRVAIDVIQQYFQANLPDYYKADVSFSGGLENTRKHNECAIDFRFHRGLRSAPHKTVHDVAKTLEGILNKMPKDT